MVKNSHRLIVTIALAFLILTPFVYSADLLEPIFSSFRGTDLGRTYQNYTAFIDAILYMWFFIVLSKGILKEKLSGGSAVAIGVILAVAMAVFETTTGFNLGKLGPFAVIILFLAVGMFLYQFISKMIDSKWAAISVAFLIIYSLLQFVAPTVIAWINKVGWLGTILSIFYIVSVIGLVYGIISLIGGAKSGEWGMFRSKNRENEADSINRKETHRDLIDLGREKKAAGDMAKLETELGNVTNNIGQLANLETEIGNRDLRNRQSQIQTLAELQSALNGAWRLQAQLQKAYGSMTRPEYANNPQFIENIKASSQQLSDFINRVEQLLVKLQQGIRDTVENEEKEEGVRKEFEKSVEKLDATVKAYNDAMIKIAEVMKKSKKSKGKPVTDYTPILNTIEERKKLFEQLRPIMLQLDVLTKKIKEYDKDNITDLDHAIKVTRNNPAEDIGAIQRMFGLAGKTAKPETVGFFQGLINTNNKYLSGDSLKQIFQSLGSVNTRLQEITSKFLAEKKKSIEERNKIIVQCNQLETAIKKELFNKLIGEMKIDQTGARQKIQVLENVFSDVEGIFTATNSMIKEDHDKIKKYIESLATKATSVTTVDTKFDKNLKKRINDVIKDATTFIGASLTNAKVRNAAKDNIKLVRDNILNDITTMKSNLAILEEVMKIEGAVSTIPAKPTPIKKP